MESDHHKDSREILLSGFAYVIGTNAVKRIGSARLSVWVIKHLVSPFQRWIYKKTDGRILSNIGQDRNVLLLTTIGRRTGKNRTIPVFYIRDGDKIVICNVKPEHESTNPWVLNLRHNPIANLQIGHDTGLYQASEATQSEIDRLWPRLTELWPAFQVHYDHGGRRSIFILEIVE